MTYDAVKEAGKLADKQVATLKKALSNKPVSNKKRLMKIEKLKESILDEIQAIRESNTKDPSVGTLATKLNLGESQLLFAIGNIKAGTSQDV